jgi:hypothetical protein
MVRHPGSYGGATTARTGPHAIRVPVSAHGRIIPAAQRPPRRGRTLLLLISNASPTLHKRSPSPWRAMRATKTATPIGALACAAAVLGDGTSTAAARLAGAAWEDGERAADALVAAGAGSRATAALHPPGRAGDDLRVPATRRARHRPPPRRTCPARSRGRSDGARRPRVLGRTGVPRRLPRAQGARALPHRGLADNRPQARPALLPHPARARAPMPRSPSPETADSFRQAQHS